MTWKLDNIDFKDYGVYVSKDIGIFDYPAIENDPHDWLDENGIDYWQPLEEIRHKDREITLYCFILANSSGYFTSRLKAFYTALRAPDKRDLSTPYTTGTIECYLEKEVKTETINRYIPGKKAGIFILKLTVAGDSPKKALTVRKPDGSVRQTIYYSSNFKLRQILLGEDYIQGNFESSEVFTVQKGDYIHLKYDEEFPGPKYFLFESPEIKKHSSNKFTCNLKFEHEFFKLRDVQFRFEGQSDFSYFATAEEVIDLLITNVQRRYSNFIKGAVESTIYLHHDFQGQSCYDVLKQLADDYEMEFSYTYDDGVSPVIGINFKQKIFYSNIGSFQYGKSNELYTVTRGKVDWSKFCTILYAEGSSKNLPADYGKQRLQMPVDNVSTDQAYIDTYGEIERSKEPPFEEIFPKRTGSITNYEVISEANEQEQAQYIIEDSSIDFNLDDYMVPNTSRKIIFQSGDLAGLEFEIHKYNHSTKKIWLIQLVDNNGNKFPNDTLKPAIGDEYILIDIYLPQAYIDAAEAELQAEAEDYLDTVCPPDIPYKVEIQQRKIMISPTTLQYFRKYVSGNYLNLTDIHFGLVNWGMRIDEVELDWYNKKYTLNLINA